MATRKHTRSTTPPAGGTEPPGSHPLPDRKVIEKRLKDVAGRICIISNMLSVSMHVINNDEDLSEGPIYSVWGVLKGAEELLGTLLDQVEPSIILNAEAQS